MKELLKKVKEQRLQHQIAVDAVDLDEMKEKVDYDVFVRLATAKASIIGQVMAYDDVILMITKRLAKEHSPST